MKNNLIALLILSTIFVSCKKDDDGDQDDPQVTVDSNKKTGLVIAVENSNSYLAKYFDTIPEETADLSDGIDLQSFRVADIYDGAIFLTNSDETGLTKYVINANGELKESGGLSSLGEAYPVRIRDAETAVYYDYGDSKSLTVFNPTTMQISGTIDMSNALYPVDEITRYRNLYVRDNLVFAPLGSRSAVWYNPFTVHVADIDAGSYQTSTSIELESWVRHNEFYGGQYEDESGNLYVPDAGNVAAGTPFRLHKINGGSTTIDTGYEFNIASALNNENPLYHAFNCFYYIGNGKAIALVSEDTPIEILTILFSVGFDASKLTDADLFAIESALDNAENGVWCEIDLNAKSVTKITGIPSQNVEKRYTIAEYEGRWYLPVENSTESTIYSYDPSTGAAQEAFDVVGGSFYKFINLANNH